MRYARARFASALLALVSATAAQAADHGCVSRGDARTLINLALPDAIEALASRCRASLPRDAFLPNEGAGLAQRMRAHVEVDPVRVRRAIQDVTGQDLSSFASDDTATMIARSFVEDQIDEHVPTRDCDTIDSMVALAAPLDPHALTDVLLIGLQAASDRQVRSMTGLKGIKGLAICSGKDEQTAP